MENERQQSIGKEKACALYDSKWWEQKRAREIAEFQMLTSELCCPFDVFHKALEETLGRPVFTHEMGMNYEGLFQELFHGKTAPTFQEIINLIPEEKRIILVTN